MKKTLSFVLVFSMILAMFTGIFTINAGAKVVTAEGNDWYGDELKVDIIAGTEGYNYMSLFRKPAHGYEFAGHFIGDNEGAQTFVIIDTEKYDGQTWSPNGLYAPGVSNYEVVYCCDVDTIIADGTYYKRLNLEDSEYYGEAAAAKIRTIVTNSYPFISFEQMKKELAENGYPYTAELTLTEVISAVQAAIWANANGKTAEDFRYVKSYRVSDNLQWGYPLHDVSNESGLDIKGKRKFATYEEVGVRHDTLVDYLLALDSTHATAEEVVITNLDIVDYAPVQAQNGTYTVALKADINNSGSSEADSISINLYVDGVLASSTPVELGKESYDLTVEAKANQKITAEVSGTQFLPKGAYFYAPKPQDVDGDGIATGREVSQNLVGVAMGATAIHSAESVTLDVPEEEIPVTVDLKLNKVNEKGNALSGASFALYAKKNGTEILVGEYAVDANGALVIENVLPGNYVIAETETPNGYESLEGTIGFTVTEEGTLRATSLPAGVKISEGEGIFEIEVTNVRTKTTISGTKYLDGKLASGFEFELYEIVNGKEVYVATAQSNKEGKFSFTVEYDAPNTSYEYVVKEVQGNNVNIVYDGSVFEASVEIDADGIATVSYEQAIVFNNVSVAPATVVIDGEKYLDGKPADGFTFVLTDAEGNEIERVECSNGYFAFSEIEFDEAATYYYYVSEIAGENDGIIYDDNVFEIKVVVEKNGDRYFSTLSIMRAEKVAFYNKTTPVEYIFEGSKYLDGIPAEGFEFAILEGDEVLSTATSDKNGKFYFTVDLAIVGDYSFQIAEIAGDDEMIVYDDTVYDVDVEVVIENGTLVATSSDVEIVFNNQTVKPASVTFSGSNYLDLVLTGGFNYALMDGEEIVARATSDANGALTLPALSFNRDGVYVYEFVELAGDVDTIVYDESIYTITVIVTLEGNELVADTKVEYTDGSHRSHFMNLRGGSNTVEISGLDFYNWTIRANTKIEGTKYLDGKAAAGFEFALIDENSNVIATAQSDENGYFFFELACNETGSFNYSVVEIAGTDAGIIYDASVIGVKVTVTRTDVELVAEISTESAVEFHNRTVPTTEPEEEITEEPTPLDPTPETTEPEEEITDPEIPLDPNPKTGDASIILAVVAIAVLALAALYIKRRQVIED